LPLLTELEMELLGRWGPGDEGLLQAGPVEATAALAAPGHSHGAEATTPAAPVPCRNLRRETNVASSASSSRSSPEAPLKAPDEPEAPLKAPDEKVMPEHHCEPG
jgi:hypothetical protein